MDDVKNYLKRLNDHQIDIYKINYLNKDRNFGYLVTVCPKL